jgi:hypothetical protein
MSLLRTYLLQQEHFSFAHSIQDMVSTPVMTSMAGLSKLTSVVLGILIDSRAASLQEAGEALELYRQMAGRIEQDWKQSKLSVVRNDEEIGMFTSPRSYSDIG